MINLWSEECLMEKNNQIREEIWKAVTGLTDEQLNQRETPDRWSIAQILEHLYNVEQGITERISKVVHENTPTPEIKPIQNATNRAYKRKSLSQPSDEFRAFESLKQKLGQSRQYLTQIIEKLTPEQWEQTSMPHPVFGEAMGLPQWIEFIGLHEQRHLEQILEVKRNLSL